MKLLAQAKLESIGVPLTEDRSTLHRYCERLRRSGYINTRAIIQAHGVDPGALRKDGQRDLFAGAEGEPPGG